jgi:pentose-5-phosphate-3-epimerase
MDSQETIDKLLKYGFENIAVRAEVRDTYNTVLHAIKSLKIKTYEHIVYEEVLAK